MIRADGTVSSGDRNVWSVSVRQCHPKTESYPGVPVWDIACEHTEVLHADPIVPSTADGRFDAGAHPVPDQGETGNMIHSTVPPGQVNRATVHATVSESGTFSRARGRYGDATARVRRRPFWEQAFPSTFLSGRHSISLRRCRPAPVPGHFNAALARRQRKRRSSKDPGDPRLPKVDDSVTTCGSSTPQSGCANRTGFLIDGHGRPGLLLDAPVTRGNPQAPGRQLPSRISEQSGRGGWDRPRRRQ